MSSCVQADKKTMSAALFLIFSLITCSSALCPPGAGWRQSGVDTTKCYLVVTSRKMWFEAEMFCQNEVKASNGHLVSISSNFETYNINCMLYMLCSNRQTDENCKKLQKLTEIHCRFSAPNGHLVSISQVYETYNINCACQIHMLRPVLQIVKN